MKNVKELAEKYYDAYANIRRTIHQNPELGTQEYMTSKLIQDELNKLGIENKVMYGTGVVGLIKGSKPGKTVLLRADMDALPVQEMADVEYKSKVDGLMHACGHDGHVAGLLGAAMILNELKDELHGNVKLMFQPDEEKNGGAKQMIEEGVLANPKVDAAFGVHLWGTVKKGEVNYRFGPMMAAPDMFKMTIKGRGAHAAMPHLGIDPVVIACDVVSQMQAIVSRKTNPLYPVVLSTCMIHGGDTFNVIPQEVKLEGTVRTLQTQTREDVPKMIENILKGVSLANGSDYELDYIFRYPPVVNDKKMTELAIDSLTKVIGADNVKELPEPNMGGEDFAYLGEKVPACFLFVGIWDQDKAQPVHHHPEFGFDDDVLKISSASLAQIAIDYLNKESELNE